VAGTTTTTAVSDVPSNTPRRDASPPAVGISENPEKTDKIASLVLVFVLSYDLHCAVREGRQKETSGSLTHVTV